MQYVRITVDGKTYNLIYTSNNEWLVTNKAPLSEGEYLITLVVTTETGQEFIFDTTDPALLNALTLLVVNGTTVSGNRMLNYYPDVVRAISEFQAIMFTEGFEVDFLKSDIVTVTNNAYFTTMEESRIQQWEQLFNVVIKADDTLEDRRDRIIALIRGQSKLNTALINAIVGSFTNGGIATSYVEDSTLYIKIKPPINNKQYKFDNIIETIQPKIPAHLGLVVVKDYATWGDIKDNFASWTAIADLDDWEIIKEYIAP